MRKQIKLMPDYYCWPLWWSGDHEPGNIDPASLPISEELVRKLEKWSGMYDSQLNIDNPGASVPLSGNTLKDFEEQGMKLWKQLCAELGDCFEVTYFSISKQKLIDDSDMTKKADK